MSQTEGASGAKAAPLRNCGTIVSKLDPSECSWMNGRVRTSVCELRVGCTACGFLCFVSSVDVQAIPPELCD